MKKIFPILMVTTILLSACNIFNNDKDQSPTDDQKIVEQKTDEEIMKEKADEIQKSQGLLTDPKILEDDELIVIGDLQVEKNENILPIQNPPTEFDLQKSKELGLSDNLPSGPKLMHHSWKYPQLHRVYLNSAIKPMWGNYAENVIQYAWKLYGKPYQYGSDRNDPSSFDCSDFTRWINLYALGLDLPKTSSTQWEYVKKFSNRKYTDLSKAKRGDLLFFMSYKGWRKDDYIGVDVKNQPIAHCGIYLGDGKMLHTASAKTGGVRVDKISGSHLEYRFVGGGNIIQ